MSYYRFKARSTTPGDYNWKTTALELSDAAAAATQLATDWLAVEAVKDHMTTDIANLLGDPDADGEIVMADYVLIANVVDPDYVLFGHDNYTDGDAGNWYPPNLGDPWTDDPAQVSSLAHYGVGNLVLGAMDMDDYVAKADVADRNGILSSYDQWTGGDPGLFDVTNFLEANIKDGVLIGGTSTEHKHGTYVGGGVDPADIVLPAFVLVGHKNYSTGSDGTYHEATVAEVQYGVTFGAAQALVGTYSQYGTYAEGAAMQLAADRSAVDAVKASIRTTVISLLGAVTGTLDLSLYVLVGVTPDAGTTETLERYYQIHRPKEVQETPNLRTITRYFRVHEADFDRLCPAKGAVSYFAANEVVTQVQRVQKRGAVFCEMHVTYVKRDTYT